MNSKTLRLTMLLAVASCSSNNAPAGPVGTGTTTMAMIGASGGMIMNPEGAALMIPQGALNNDTMISITALTSAPTSFSTWSSPIYKFGPDGLMFNTPVTAQLNFTGTPQDPTIFLTAPGSGSFQDIGGIVSGNSISTSVLHFSECIVAPRTAYNSGAGCTALVNDAPQINDVYDPTDPPTPMGGMIVAGTYNLTARTRYTGPGGRSGTDTTTSRKTKVRISNVSGSTANIEIAEVRPEGDQRQSGTITVSGVDLTLNATCPAGQNTGDLNHFTSNGNTFLVFELDNNNNNNQSDGGPSDGGSSDGGPSDGGSNAPETKVMTFTRQ